MKIQDPGYDPRKIKGVFFDLFGTLFVSDDMGRVWDECFRELHAGLVRLGAKADPDEAALAADDFFNWHFGPRAGEAGATLYERRILELGRRLKRPLGRGEAAALAESSTAAAQGCLRFDEKAYAVFKALKGDKKMALITNFDHPPQVRKLIAEYALDRFFDHVIISSEVGFDKPDPRIFALALEKTGLKPGEVVYVGDSLEHDVRGARAAGLFPLLIRRSGAEEGSGRGAAPLAVISSLTEIFKYL